MNDAWSSPPLIVGIGNSFRGDDALGLLVAREIARRHPSGVRVEEG